MGELVFMDYGPDVIPFTTSDVIAEYAGVKHHAIQVLLDKHREDFEELGLLAFEMRAVKVKGSRGTKYLKIYHLTEEQATLLITYLRNTPQVRAFKKELVRQFYQMREELTKRKIERVSLKPVRRNMTDAIRDFIPESPHKAMQYQNYTNLAYLTATGMTAKAIRRSRGAAKDANAADYLTTEELRTVERVSGHISILIESGLAYGQVREILARTNQLLAQKL